MDVSVMSVVAAIGAGVIALIYGFITVQQVLKASPGNARMQEIAAAIQEGANAYLNRQYTTIAIVGVVIAVLLTFLFTITTSLAFVVGAVLSGLAGYVGMLVSVRANVRTTEASRNSLAAGLSMAFRSGAVTGMLVAGLALIGVAGYYYILTEVIGLEPTSREVIELFRRLNEEKNLIDISSTEEMVTIDGHVTSEELKALAEEVVTTYLKDSNATQKVKNNLTIMK